MKMTWVSAAFLTFTSSIVAQSLKLCTVSPDSVLSGDTATVSCSCDSVTDWRANAGRLTAQGKTAQVSTVGLPGMTITITARCYVNGTGINVTESFTIVGQIKPFNSHSSPFDHPIPTEYSAEIMFDGLPSEPAAIVPNVQAGLRFWLERITQNPSNRLVIVGSSYAPDEYRVKIASQRAVNAKAYLIALSKIEHLAIERNRIELRRVAIGISDSIKLYILPAGQASGDDLRNTYIVDEQQIQPSSCLSWKKEPDGWYACSPTI